MSQPCGSRSPAPTPAQPQGTLPGASRPRSQKSPRSAMAPVPRRLARGPSPPRGELRGAGPGDVDAPRLGDLASALCKRQQPPREEEVLHHDVGGTEPCGKRRGEVRAAIPPPAVPATTASRRVPPAQPSAGAATVPPELQALAVFPGPNQEIHH